MRGGKITGEYVEWFLVYKLSTVSLADSCRQIDKGRAGRFGQWNFKITNCPPSPLCRNSPLPTSFTSAPVTMHGLDVLLLLGSAAATSQAPPSTLQSSASLRRPLDGNVAGGSLDSLTKDGWWHWLPGFGHGGIPSIPGWTPSKGKCKQIQNKFRHGENGKGSKNYERAQDVKVCMSHKRATPRTEMWTVWTVH